MENDDEGNGVWIGQRGGCHDRLPVPAPMADSRNSCDFAAVGNVELLANSQGWPSMTPTVKSELATLRQRVADLEWEAAAIDETAREKLLAEIDRANHRIAYLSEYERLGYEHEPNF